MFIVAQIRELYVKDELLQEDGLINLSKGNVINQITIDYTPENIYVSRSCGYKVIFNNVTFSSTNSWITDFTPSTLTTIDNQNAAHIQVYH